MPSSVSSATNSIDVSSWGAPSAAYPSSSCDIGNYFTAQQLVIDITLCGDWYVSFSFPLPSHPSPTMTR